MAKNDERIFKIFSFAFQRWTKVLVVLEECDQLNDDHFILGWTILLHRMYYEKKIIIMTMTQCNQEHFSPSHPFNIMHPPAGTCEVKTSALLPWGNMVQHLP